MKKTIPFFLTTLFLFTLTFSLPLAAQVTVQIGTGTDVSASTLYSPLYRFSATSTTNGSRANILFTQAELAATGIPIGAAITAVEFNKANVANFITPCTYTMYMANTSNTALATTLTWASIQTTHTQVFTNSSFNIPSAAGWVLWNVTPFIYTGGALEIANEVAMGGNGAATDAFKWEYTATTPTDKIVGVASATGATLNGTVTGYKYRPNIRITYSLNAPCTSPPTPGTATSSVTSMVCPGTSIILNLTGNSFGTGQTYQWQSATSLAGTYTNEGSSSTFPTLTVNPVVTTYYRCTVTCGGGLAVSTPVQVSVAPLFAAGTYTINSAISTGGTNFQSFAAATNSINCGINGPVVFNVAAGSGPYNEQVSIKDVSGTSATNSITINGNGATISFNSTVSGERAGIKLDGADYITIDNLIITGTGSAATDYNWGIQLLNNADFNTIRNCTINMPITGTSTNFSGIVISGSAISATISGSACDGNIISNNRISGGYYGITLIGTSTSGSLITGNQIKNNIVSDFYFYGLYVSGTQNTLIEGNDISRPLRPSTSISSFYGIYLTTLSENTLINKNRIHDPFAMAPASASGFYGIYLNASDPVAGRENLITNNLVYNANAGGVQYGIYNGGSDSCRFYHNSILLDDAAYTGTSITYGIYQATTARGIAFKNNIVKISRGGAGTKYCLYFAATGTASTIVSSFNDLLITSTSGTNGIGYLALPAPATGYPTLDGWQGVAGQDANSVSIEPTFVNASGGNLQPTATLLDNGGTLVGVLKDFADVTRSNISPDMGAYEFLTIPLPIQLIRFSATKANADAAISWMVASEINFSHYEVEYSTNGAGFLRVGTQAAGGRAYRFLHKDAIAKAGTPVIYYRLKMMDKDGKFSYSPIAAIHVAREIATVIETYPNPFVSSLNLRLNVLQNTDVRADLVDAAGRTIVKKIYKIPAGNSTLVMNDLQKLQPGIYMLVITMNGKTTLLKVVK